MHHTFMLYSIKLDVLNGFLHLINIAFNRVNKLFLFVLKY